jgi:branched-chain amino acid transport system ATP-binding protein
VLEIKDVTKKFGGFAALSDCTFVVNPQEILGLIGPNGAGKSTLINAISGIFRINSGSIEYKGQPIHNKPSYRIAQMGIGRTYQITRIFRGISCFENLITAGLVMNTDRDAVIAKAEETLELLEITGIRDEYAGKISIGQQKLLELGMKLMLDSDFLLLDEPFHGIHPKLVEKILGIIRKLNERGKTFLVVSHDLHSIAALCQRVVVLNFGEVIAEGKPDEIRSNKDVVNVYLGA